MAELESEKAVKLVPRKRRQLSKQAFPGASWDALLQMATENQEYLYFPNLLISG